MKKFSSILVLTFYCLISTIVHGQTTWTNLTYSENQANIEFNPLKGFVNSNNDNQTNFPASLQFGYFPLKDVYKGWGEYDWSPVEAKMNAALDSGNQYFLRFYIVYPGLEYAMPDFLQPLVPYEGKSPDYNDPDLMKAFLEFIAEYGKRYNNDPRLAFADYDIGLVESWGEWNYVSTAPPAAYKITKANGEKIIQSFKDAFPNKKILLRYPETTTDPILKTSVGYYDDSFGKTTLYYDETWSFISQMITNDLMDNWKTNLNGGEVHPEIDVDDMYAVVPYIHGTGTSACNLDSCILVTHSTWVRDNSIFTDKTPYNRANALRASEMQGYKLYARSAKLTPNTNGTVKVEVQMQDKGITPF